MWGCGIEGWQEPDAAFSPGVMQGCGGSHHGVFVLIRGGVHEHRTSAGEASVFVADAVFDPEELLVLLVAAIAVTEDAMVARLGLDRQRDWRVWVNPVGAASCSALLASWARVGRNNVAKPAFDTKHAEIVEVGGLDGVGRLQVEGSAGRRALVQVDLDDVGLAQPALGERGGGQSKTTPRREKGEGGIHLDELLRSQEVPAITSGRIGPHDAQTSPVRRVAGRCLQVWQVGL